MAIGLYAGPGKVYRAADTSSVGGAIAAANATTFQAEGENGPIDLKVDEPTAEIASAMHGRIDEQVLDQVVDLSFKSFDNWGVIPQLFPPWVGVDTSAIAGGSAASLAIGGRPFNTPHVATKVWTPDGRLYTIIRSAVLKSPDLHLGIGKALFGETHIFGIGDETVGSPFTNAYLLSSPVTESAGADPSATSMTMADFERGAWTGVWGTVAGFGGGAGSLGGTNAIQAEDEWTITVESRYSMLKVQGRTVAAKLDNVNIMVKVKPYGPSHTDIMNALGAHTPGMRLGASTTRQLVLTGPGGKTITFPTVGIKGGGFKFGGTTLGTDEIGFVTGTIFTSGVPGSFMTFSA